MKRAATVTKEDFPRFLYRLWEVSFLPRHLKSGFLKCGLCPLEREAILSQRLSKALPHKKPPTESSSNVTGEISSSFTVTGESSSKMTEESSTATDSGDGDSNAKTEVVIHLTGELSMNSTVTPIRLHLRGYFAHLLQKNKLGRKRTENKQKLKPKFYGEALTLDEFYSKITEEEEKATKLKEAAAQKKASKQLAKEQKKKEAMERKEAAKQKKATKKKKTVKTGIATRIRASKATRSSPAVQTVVKSKPPVPSPIVSSSSSEGEVSSTDDDGCCEECGGCYKDDDRATRKCWIGCDLCQRWFHCSCVGLRAVPKGFWSCKYC